MPQKSRRVAIYIRVSTLNEEQELSLKAQKAELSRLVQNHEDWSLVKVYSDHGLSGTNIKYRKAFNQMLEDARKHKFDLIITKSISRFSRNTITTLSAIRELKSLGIEVFFDKEHISTISSDGEMLITIMSSIAQEESRNMSENIKWSIEHKMDQGKFSLAYKNFLGYKKGKDGKLEIVEEEAEIVRKIYKMFLRGISINSIAALLTKAEIKTPTGKTRWTDGTVRNILTNEKYKGDALLQKTYTPNYLTHKKVSNKNAEHFRQIYVGNSHPAIVSPETFQAVQDEIKRRKESGQRRSFYAP